MPTDFSRQVYDLVSRIPAGRVATYGPGPDASSAI